MCLDTDPKTDKSIWQEVRILSVLATVLVRKHKVVTVVVLHNEQPQQGELVQGIACSRQDDPEEQQMCSTSPSNFVDHFWKIWTVGNYRRDGEQSALESRG